MQKKYLLILAGFCTLLVNVSAQVVTDHKGLKTVEFSYPQGKIKLYLPDDWRSGDIISGSVKIEPEGKNDKQKEKALSELSKRIIKIGNPDGTNHEAEVSLNNYSDIGVKIKLEISSLPLSVIVFNDNKQEQSIELKQSSSGANKNIDQKCQLPTHALVAAPVSIPGAFDGDASNTKCTVDNKPIEILAESPRQTIINYPSDAKDIHTLIVQEKDQPQCESKVSGVDMDLSTGRLNLQKGENTYVDITITGLQNLPSDATLTVTNTTTGVVTMAGGETQVLPIAPDSVSGEGTFNRRFNLHSIKTGSFSVDVNLDLPDNSNSPINNTASNWVVCDLNGISCILPLSKCEELHNGLANQTSSLSASTTSSDSEPQFFSSFTNNSEMEGSIQQTFTTTQGITDRVVFAYHKLGSSEAKQDTVLIGIDSTSNDGFQNSYPSSFLENGVYNLTTVGYYGTNQTIVQNDIIVVPSQPQRPSVSNSEIEKLKRKEQELRDSINNINRRIQNGTNQMNDNYKQRHYLDSLRSIQSALQYQLQKIDAVIDQIPGTYGSALSNLLDSLERFNKKVGGLNGQGLQDALDKMNDRVKELEDALKACMDHLAALQKEQTELANEKSQIENDQEQAYRDILDACRQAGYNAGGSSGRNAATGQFKYNYGLILRGDNGDPEFVQGIPAQALKKVSESEKKIKNGNNRIAEINARQQQLPGEIDAAKKECDELSKLLAAAKETQRKGANALTEYNFNMADIAELCREIKELLQPLADWCVAHPGECSSFEMQLKSIMNDCPDNISNLPNFMNSLNNIITAKKTKEEEHKKQSNQLSGQITEIDKKNEVIGTQVNNDEEKGKEYGTSLGKTMKDIDKAITDEIARRQQAEADRKAELKRRCIEFLRSQAKSPEEADLIEEIAKVKDQMQSMAEDIKSASELGDRITKDKLKDLTDKLRDKIDKLLGEFEKFDKLKGKLDELKEIKQDLETVFKSDKSAKENAEAMGVILKRIKEQLDKVADEFPILKLFTAYFGFMVDAFNAITSKANQIVEDYVASLVRMALERTDCSVFANEYMKNNSVDDAVRKGYDIYKGTGLDAATDTPERRRMLEEQIRKYVLQKITDCCLRWAVQ